MNLRNFLLACICSTVLLVTTLSADTIPGGDVSGTWFQSHSPYYIAGNITIQSGDTLVIEPGVLVEFLGGYVFTVQGYLEAIGTEADSITFTASTVWYGLYIANVPDTCRFEYCVLENFGYFMFSAIFCQNTTTVISHCRISNNESYGECAGITLYNSDTEISYCTISENTGIKGAGILCHDGSTPIIFKCSITYNKLSGGLYGGGIAIDGGSNPVIDSCIISNNSAQRGGGIAVLNGSSCMITDCWLSTDSAFGVGTRDNGGGIFINSPGGIITMSGTTVNACYSFDSGGGIYIQDAASVSIRRSIFDANSSPAGGSGLCSVDCGDLSIDHCDIVNNYAPLQASGIVLNGMTDLTLSNCIFRSQSRDDIWFEKYSSASVTYSDFYDWGPGGPFGGDPPAGLGTLVQTNHNGDSCDVFYNIYIDPLFEDFPRGNYFLTDSSPCIDAGDPTSPKDPDSTITDMGCYYFDQSSGVEEGQDNPRCRIQDTRLKIYPNPFRNRTAIKFQNPNPKSQNKDVGQGFNLALKIYNASGRLVKSCNLGSLLVAHGSLLLTWDGRDNSGKHLPPGVYFVELKSGSLSQTAKVLFIK